MTYTRSAIGLLTRQYRSVLRKCFLINCGLFALGAVSAMSANPAEATVSLPTPTLDVKHAEDPTTYPNGSAYKYGEGVADNYDVKVTDGTDSAYGIIEIKDEIKDDKVKIDWTDNGSTATGSYANNYITGSDVTISGTTISGAIRLMMSHNGTIPTSWNRYFTYTYTTPTGYQITQTRLNNNITSDNVNKKVFAKITSSSNGGAIYNTKNSGVNIISDFYFVGSSSSSANAREEQFLMMVLLLPTLQASIVSSETLWVITPTPLPAQSLVVQ